MTEIEKAIEFVNDIKRALAYHKEKTVCLVRIPLERAFNFDTMLEALQEKAEREKGCELCNDEYTKQYSISLGHKYCCKCGRKLVSEESHDS